MMVQDLAESTLKPIYYGSFINQLLSDTIKLMQRLRRIRGCPRGVMVKAMNFGIVVREFVLQSRYYVHFRANTLGKGMNPSYSPSYGSNSTTTVIFGE